MNDGEGGLIGVESERHEEEEPDIDPGADTGRFRAFVQGDDGEVVSGPAERGGSNRGFRLATLAVGLVVFAGVVWLLLQ